MLVHLQKLAVVHNLPDHLLHIVGLVGIVRHDRVQRRRLAQRVVAAGLERRILHVVARQIVHQLLHKEEGVLFVLGGEVGNAGLAGMDDGAAQFFKGDVLVGHRLDHIRPGHEHVARVLDHDHEVGDGRAIDRAAGARSHDHADLRHDARCHHIAIEDFGIAGQAVDAFLDARAA